MYREGYGNLLERRHEFLLPEVNELASLKTLGKACGVVIDSAIMNLL